MQKWTLLGKTRHAPGKCLRQLIALICITHRLLKTEEQKNKRVHWKIKRMLKQAWYSFVFSMLCICDAGSGYSTFVEMNRGGAKRVLPGKT